MGREFSIFRAVFVLQRVKLSKSTFPAIFSLLSVLHCRRPIIVPCILCKVVAFVLADLFRGSVIDVLQGKEFQISQRPVNAHVETKIHGLGIMLVQFPVAMPVEHNGAIRLLFQVTMG